MVFFGTGILFAAILWINAPSGGNQSVAIEPSPTSDEKTLSSSVLDPVTPIQQIEKNESFEIFTPAKLEDRKVDQQSPSITNNESPIRKLLPVPTPASVPISHEPLIKEEHSPAEISSTQEPAHSPTLPTLETDARIHCQLLTPVTTDFDNAPVEAIVTRPLIRNGVLIIPKGTKVSGKVQSTKNERIFFDTNWSLVNSVGKPVAISGMARQKSNDTSDGHLGLPGFLENQPQAGTTGKEILGSLIKGVAELGKETVRTNVGEFVPGTGRNAIINGSSRVVDQLLTKPKDPSIKNEPYIHVLAGTEFYLIVSSEGNSPQREITEQSNLDSLLEQMMKKRLER